MFRIQRMHKTVPFILAFLFILNMMIIKYEDNNNKNLVRLFEKRAVKSFSKKRSFQFEESSLESRSNIKMILETNSKWGKKEENEENEEKEMRTREKEVKENEETEMRTREKDLKFQSEIVVNGEYKINSEDQREGDRKIAEDQKGDNLQITNDRKVKEFYVRKRNLTTKMNIPKDDYIDKLENLISGHLTPAELVASPKPNAVDIGMIIVNPKKSSHFDPFFESKTRFSFDLIFKYANHRTPLHFILVTDEFSKKQTGVLMQSIVSKLISYTLIQNVYKKRIGVPPLYFSLVDYQNIKKAKPEFVNSFRSLNETDIKGKYNEDFFFIAPLYHLAFKSLQKLIVIDCQDLEIKTDISDLNDQFYHFKSFNILGIGLDLSPHYRINLQIYREENPDTHVGDPGPLQGFNSGMVLYDLERMRNNEIFNRYLEPENMKQLMKMYRYRSILAEQDWFTNLGFTYPDLFYVLPCTYNAQTTLEYMREGPEKDYFDDYHFCDKFHNLKVVHYNGCGSQPINCGHTGDPSKHMSQKYKDGVYIPPNIEGLDWLFFERIRTGKIRFKFNHLTQSVDMIQM